MTGNRTAWELVLNGTYVVGAALGQPLARIIKVCDDRLSEAEPNRRSSLLQTS